jgi:predicted transcriptional regulator YdeE
MQPKIITKPGFKIICIEVRTSNPDEMSGKGKIGELWQKFSSENILPKIPGNVAMQSSRPTPIMKVT